MTDISAILFFSTFLAGILTAFLPCTYPVILGYIGLLASKGGSIVLKTLFFFIGFSFTYIIFGSIAGFIGLFTSTSIFVNEIKYAAQYIEGFVFLIIAFSILHIIPMPNFMKGIKSIKFSKVSLNSWWAATAFGAIFAAGWSPCIGPVLGGILILASASESVILGSFLLFVFSLGLLIPVFILAILYKLTAGRLAGFDKYAMPARIITGFIFLFIAILSFTGQLSILSSIQPPEFIFSYL